MPALNETVPPAIGGYFALDLPQQNFRHSGSLLLNTGRACIETVLTARGTRRVYLPRYTCDVVLEPMRKLGVPFEFYGVDEDLSIPSVPQPGEGELLIVNNYFGLQTSFCERLSMQLGDRLIVDCSQAWYAPPIVRSHCFYTPRKFFGVPDGGCLYSAEIASVDSEADVSGDRLSHLVKRFELGPEAGFGDFRRNDSALSGAPVRRMSELTARLLGLADHEQARQRRIKNFTLVDQALGSRNRLDWSGADQTGPMVYPYLPDAGADSLRRRLLEQRVFVPTYWPNVLTWCSPGDPEYMLASELLPLPIDQRYGRECLLRMLDILA